MDGLDEASWEAMCANFYTVRGHHLNQEYKMTYWINSIRDLCITRKTAIFQLSQLPVDFQRYGRMPKCLAVVVQHMVSQGLVRRLSVCMNALDPEASRWSVFDIIQKPLSFGLNCLRDWFGQAKSNDCTDDEPYVVADLVQSLADEILEAQRKRIGGSLPSSDNLISYCNLRNMSSAVVSDDPSFRLALLHLSAQSRCFITLGNDGQKLVRFSMAGEQVVPPTPAELSLYRLREAVRNLETKMNEIKQQQSRYKITARNCLLAEKKNEAERYLRRKLKLDPVLKTKEQTLESIIDLIMTIEQTESQKQTLDAFRSGMAGIKAIKEECRMTVDEVDDTMLDMQTMMDECREISTSLTTPTTDDDDDIERQLNDLLVSSGPSALHANSGLDGEESQAAAAAAAASLQMPSVPSDDPSDRRQPATQESTSSDRRQPATQESTSSDRRQPANKSVTVKFGKAKKSLKE